MVPFRADTTALLLQRYCFLTPDAALQAVQSVPEHRQAAVSAYLARCKWTILVLYAVSALSLIPFFAKKELSWLSPPMLALDGICLVLCGIWYFYRRKALAG